MATLPVDDDVTRIEGDGVRLAADLRGDPSGPPVLLVHGIGQTRHAWGAAASALAAEGRRTCAIDLRGHGDSDWSPDGGYGIDRHCADVRAVVRGLGRRPALVGASMGGIASLLAIGEATEQIATCLVLVDVTPKVDVARGEGVARFMRSGMQGFDTLEEAANVIAAYRPHRPRPADLSGLRKNLRQRGDGRWYWHWDVRMMGDGSPRPGGARSGFEHDRLAAAARNVSVPTLLVRGGMSEIVTDDGVRDLQRLIPHAEIVEVAGAGHMVAGDRNDAFAGAVVDFVRRVGP
jgi:non-heme chloroperoxidase